MRMITSMKNTTEYIYGIKPEVFADLPYRDALVVKRDAAESHVRTLITPHFMERDDARFSAAYDAVKFNQKLIDELEK